MRVTENEVVERHHQLNGHEFEQTPGESEGQGSLACCSLWGCKKSDTTEQLNNNTVIKGEVGSNTINVWDFNISFSSMDKSFRQNKETQALNDTLDQMNVIFIEYSIQKQQTTHSSRVHTEHSTGLTACQATR